MSNFNPLCIDLRGRVALVTGASGGLGSVMARTLGACGAAVAIHYHHGVGKAQALALELAGAGVRTCLVGADLTRQADVQAMAAEVAMELGNPDIVVANAVIQYEWRTVLDQDPADYQAQFDCCVMQSVYLAKAFVPAMQQKGWGRFIAINTECAMQALPNQSAYVAGKKGLDGMLRVLAKEVGPSGVTVNQVAPGWTITEQSRAEGTDRNSGYEATVPLRRRGTDVEVAQAVAFLGSDLAAFVTGVYLPVAGGTVMPAI